MVLGASTVSLGVSRVVLGGARWFWGGLPPPPPPNPYFLKLSSVYGGFQPKKGGVFDCNPVPEVVHTHIITDLNAN